MNISFANKQVNCRHLNLAPRAIKEGDFIQTTEGLFLVETIQRNCPSIDRRVSFTHWILVDTKGNRLLTRTVFGTQEVFRERTL